MWPQCERERAQRLGCHWRWRSLVVTAALVAGTLSAAAASPAEASSSSSERLGRQLVKNASFERGKKGWRVNDRTSTRLRAIRGGPRGHRAIRLKALKRHRNLVLNDRRNTVRRAPKGARYRFSAYVRSRDRVVGELRVRQVKKPKRQGGRPRVAVRRERFRLHYRHWEHVSFTFVVKRDRSALDLNVAVRKAKRGQVLDIDGVSLRRVHRRPAAAPKHPREGGRLSNGCTYSARGLPSCGAYVGIAHGANESTRGFEQRAGQPVGVHRTFWQADEVDKALASARADVTARRIPWLSFKLPHSWAAMAAGQGDGWARTIARRLAALDGPVWIAFHHEPEGDGAIGDWRRLQERLAPLVRSTATNVAYTVILTGWHQFYGNTTAYGLDVLWPRRTKVDVAGFDIYNRYGVPGSPTLKPSNFRAEYFEALSRWARAQKVRWGLAETGMTDATAQQDPAWLARTYQQMNATEGVAMAYFNSPWARSGDWLLDTEDRQKQFVDLLRGSPVRTR